MTANNHTTREGWLVDAIGLLRTEFFTSRGHKVPAKLQVACGWVQGGKNAIGQCWAPSASSDETTQMYISPTEADAARVLDILLHEMIHAVVGTKYGHKGPFRTLAKDFGLAGKMTATYAEEGSPLKALLVIIAGKLGPYPHAAMTKKEVTKANPYKWTRLMSPSDGHYVVTISPKMVEQHGLPVDPWGDEMVEWVK